MTDKLKQFLKETAKDEEKPVGIEWFASVQCQNCGESVPQQTYYVEDSVLFWKCSSGHRSMMENFKVM